MLANMARRPDVERFLRAAVKTGLRMQNHQVAMSAPGAGQAETVSEGVATLQRIKAPLSKRKTVNRAKP